MGYRATTVQSARTEVSSSCGGGRRQVVVVAMSAGEAVVGETVVRVVGVTGVVWQKWETSTVISARQGVEPRQDTTRDDQRR